MNKTGEFIEDVVTLVLWTAGLTGSLWALFFFRALAVGVA